MKKHLTVTTSSLPNLVNNLAGKIQKINCKYKHNDKYVKLSELIKKSVGDFSNKGTLKIIIQMLILQDKLS